MSVGELTEEGAERVQGTAEVSWEKQWKEKRNRTVVNVYPSTLFLVGSRVIYQSNPDQVHLMSSRMSIARTREDTLNYDRIFLVSAIKHLVDFIYQDF